MLDVKEIVSTPCEDLSQNPLEKKSILEWVRNWGGSASDAVLDPTNQIFHVSKVKGLIGYRIENGCAIVFGDPICPPENYQILTKTFREFSEKKGWNNIIYLTSSEPFSKWALTQGISTALVEFGKELIINPQEDPRNKKGTHASLVRRKVKHAQHENVEVHEYTGNNPHLEKELEEVGKQWLSSRKGPQIYTSHVRLFDDRLGKRWFYANQKGKMMGTLVLNHLKTHDGWLMNHLMITQNAPHGTPELLVITALETLAKENCRYVTFGSVPANRLGEMIGFNGWITGIARFAFAFSKKIFRIDGHRKFWEKFAPQEKSSYLAFGKPHIGINELKAVFRALNVNF